MKITVIGAGRWGSFIAWYTDSLGHEVTLFDRNKERISELDRTRTLSYDNISVAFSDHIRFSDQLSSVRNAEVIIISINSQNVRSLMKDLDSFNLKNKIFLLCMKGIEISTGKRLSEIVSELTDPSNDVAIWAGPGHVQEFAAGHPNCMVIDSADEAVKDKLINAFSGELIRFYYGNDLIGNEIGAAAKNVIGIAAGMLDGLGLTVLKGALMARGTREVARLIKVMGGNELSAYGLCHLGDYEATLFSEFSHNRRFGEAFVRKEKFDKLAEGYFTVAALVNLGKRYQVELPITEAVYGVLYENADVGASMKKLFSRSLKKEF